MLATPAMLRDSSISSLSSAEFIRISNCSLTSWFVQHTSSLVTLSVPGVLFFLSLLIIKFSSSIVKSESFIFPSLPNFLGLIFLGGRSTAGAHCTVSKYSAAFSAYFAAGMCFPCESLNLQNLGVNFDFILFIPSHLCPFSSASFSCSSL